MKKTTFILSGLLVIFTLSLSSSALALNVRFNVMYSPKHPLVREAFNPWAEQVAKVTDGRVKVTVFTSSALCKPKQVFDSTIQRVTDMGVSCPTYARDRFLMSGVMDLPMVAGEKAKISGETLWQLYEKYPEFKKEYSEVKLLWMYVNPAYQLHFTKKEAHKLEDLKNMVISAGGTVSSKIMSALGASVEAMPMTEVYLALQKGVIEGCFLPYAPLRSQRMADLLHYHTEVDLVANTFYVVMNKDVWGKISPQDQKAIEKISGIEGARFCGSVFDRYQDKDKAWMAKKGDKFYRLSPDERKRWSERILPIRDGWIKDAKAKGFPAEQLLSDALKMMDEKSQ